jgi:hypothetical protein
MRRVAWLVLGFVAVVFAFAHAAERRIAPAAGGTKGDPLPPPLPVESSMHEFMEYMMEPSYLRLKDTMASQSKKPTPEQAKKNWKSIKGDALVLAEAANLLLTRLPEKDKAAWANHAFAVREAGSQLYQAAKKKDDAVAASAYRTMLARCNACHKQFAEGKHQLEP